MIDEINLFVLLTRSVGARRRGKSRILRERSITCFPRYCVSISFRAFELSTSGAGARHIIRHRDGGGKKAGIIKTRHTFPIILPHDSRVSFARKKSSRLVPYFFSREIIRFSGRVINLRGYTRARLDSGQVKARSASIAS